MTQALRLPVASFDELASGGGGAATVALLRTAQLSRCVLRLLAVLDLAGQRFPAELRRSGAEDAFAVLADVQSASPEVVARVLAHPTVGAWAMRCLRRLQGAADGGAPLESDLGHLGAVAAAAAHLAGTDVEVRVPVRAGTVTLPLLGQARLPGGWGTGTVRRDRSGTRVAGGAGRVWLPADPAADGPGWTALRRIAVGEGRHRLDVCLDDLDPFRDCYGQRPAGRVGADAFAGWRRLVGQAWDLLARDHPEYAEALGAGLTTLVPLRQAGPLDGVSASSRGSFGAVALTAPRDPVSLAATLVHEFQHSKLGALLDLVPLYEDGGTETYYAPWRDDPRPVGGLLQGAYAFTGVTDFWRVRRSLGGPDARLAQVEFARWREPLLRTLRALLDSGALTRLGSRFVTGLHRRVAAWPDLPVPAAELDLGRTIAADHALCWRLRNLRPDPAAVAALAAAWRAGEPPPRPPVPSTVVTGGRATPGLPSSPRSTLLRLRVRDGSGSGRPDGDGPRRQSVAGATPADLAFAAGDRRLAARRYLALVAADPGSVTAWAGLALSLDPPVAALRDAPEVVRAVYLRLRVDGATPPDPATLAAWLTPA